MEELKAMYPICTLIKSDGTRCGSPAVTGTNFCFHHIGGKPAKPKTETPVASTPLKFVYPDSYAAIQHNLFLVVEAFNEGKIDNRTANTYNRLFRACELNLSKCEAANARIRLPKAPQEEAENVRKPAESVQQPADTEPDATPGDNTIDESLRRFRDWQQSPQAQAFARMHSDLNSGRRSPDPEAARPESPPVNAGTLG